MKRIAILLVLLSAFLLVSCDKNNGKGPGARLMKKLSFSSVVPVPGEKDQALAVSAGLPSGKVTSMKDLQTVTVVFSKSMVPLSPSWEEYDGSKLLTFEPEVKGKYKWNGTSTLVFVPDKPFEAGRRYKATVSGEAKSIYGDSMGKPYEWTIEALPPEALSIYPSGDGVVYHQIGQPVMVRFNQKPDMASATNFIKLSKVDGNSEAGIPAKVRAAVKEDFTEKDLKDVDPEHCVAVVPESGLDFGSSYRIEILQGFKIGELSMEKPRSFSFTTEKKFDFLESKNPEVSMEDGMFLTFSNPVKSSSLAEYISVSPSVKAAESLKESDDTGVTQYIPSRLLRPATEYTVTVKADLEDINGNKLGKNVTRTYRTGDYKPKVMMQEGMCVTSRKTVPVNVVNLPSVSVVARKMSRTDLISYCKASLTKEKMAIGEDGASFDSVSTGCARNERKTVEIDLSKYLNGESGAVYFAVKNPNETNQYDNGKIAVVEVTGLAVHAKLSPANGVVWVTSKDGEPVGDADVEIRNELNEVVCSGKTNPDGCYEFGNIDAIVKGKSDKTLYVFASKGGDEAFLASDWDWGINLWDLDFSVGSYRWHYDMSSTLFTDRGIYKPGDTVRLKGVVRKKTAEGLVVPDVRKYALKISDSRSGKIAESDVSLSDNGTFDYVFVLDKNVPTGNCSVSFTMEENGDKKYLAGTSFDVFEYKAADLTADTTLKEKEMFGASSVAGSLKAAWLFGAPLKDSEFTWSLVAERSRFAPPNCGDYYFGRDGMDDEEDQGLMTLASGKGVLSDKGTASIKAEFDKSKLPENASVTLETTVKSAKTDLSSRAVANWHRSELFIGAKPESYIATAGKEFTIDTACFKADGKPYAPTALTADIVKRTWNSVKKETIEDGVSWITKKNDEKVATVNISSSDHVVKFTPEKSGYYVACISGKDKGGNASVTEAGFYVSGSDECGWEQKDSSVMSLKTDKKSYKPGDTAKVFVPSPYKSAKALITSERNSIVVRKVVELKGNSSVIEVPVSESDIPGTFVSVTLVPKGGSDDPKGLVRVGYAEITVSADSKKLSVSASPDKKDYRPGENATVKISVKDSSGNPVKGEVTLAVVDDGVLSLNGYRLPDLFSGFYSRPTLDVSVYDVSTNALTLASYDEKGDNGGGGEESSLYPSARKNFVDTAYWNPSIMTDSSGKAEISFKMPDNLTSFRIMAVAVEGKSFSSLSEDTVTVSQPVIVKAAVPSFAHPGDEIVCGVTIVNNSKSKISAKVALEQKEMELLDSADSKTVQIKAGGEEPVLFRLKALKNGNCQLYFRTEAGGEKDELLAGIPVISSENGMRSAAFAGISSAATAKEKIDVGEIAPGTGKISVSIGGGEYDQLKAAFKYLDDYSLTCLEQLTSRALPYVDAQAFMKYMGKSGKEPLVESWINKAEERQDRYGTGGFSLWGGDSEVSDYLSCYVMEALIKAEKAGYKIGDGPKNSGLSYMRRIAGRPIDKDWKPYLSEQDRYFLKAYAVYVLALAGQPSNADRNNLADNMDKLDLNGKSMLLRAYAVKRNDWSSLDTMDMIKDSMLNSIRTESRLAWFENNSYNPSFHSSGATTTALAYMALIEGYDQFPESDKVFLWLNSKRKNGIWSNTHENALCLSASSRGIALHPAPTGSFQATARLGGEVIAKGVVNPGNAYQPSSAVTAEVPLKDGAKTEIAFEKNAGGNMYYSALLSWQPAGEIKAYDGGFSVMKIMEPIEGKFNGEFKEGEIYKVTVSVSTTRDRDFAVLCDSVPAGFEVVNTSFKTESVKMAAALESAREANAKRNGWSSFNHYEYYGDRVQAFSDKMSSGEHLMTYFVRARYKGKFNMFPAKAFMMYNPEIYGCSNSSEIEIK